MNMPDDIYSQIKYRGYKINFIIGDLDIVSVPELELEYSWDLSLNYEYNTLRAKQAIDERIRLKRRNQEEMFNIKSDFND